MRLDVSSVPFYVSVAGNIGAGKTTLLEKLSECSSLAVYPEEPDKNIFFESFSEDAKKWALPTQLTYFVEYMNKAMLAQQSAKVGVVERTIYENVEVFLRNLFESKEIGPEDFHALLQIYDRVKFSIPRPRKIFYIKADLDTLIERIERRARPAENVSLKYLEDLEVLYSKWIKNNDYCDVVTLDGNEDEAAVLEQFWYRM